MIWCNQIIYAWRTSIVNENFRGYFRSTHREVFCEKRVKDLQENIISVRRKETMNNRDSCPEVFLKIPEYFQENIATIDEYSG